MKHIYEDGDIKVDRYANYEFQLNMDDRKSILRFIFTLNRVAVS
jgi:hypothetical protein